MNEIADVCRFVEAVMNEFWEKYKAASDGLDALMTMRQSQILQGRLDEDEYCAEWCDTPLSEEKSQKKRRLKLVR